LPDGRKQHKPRLSVSQFAVVILLAGQEGRAMDHLHYSRLFGLSLAAALGLMLALSALAQSAHPKNGGAQEVAGRHLAR